MKILPSIGFIIVFVLNAVVYQLGMQTPFIEGLAKGKLPSDLRQILIAVAALVFLFVEYWLLTGLLPVNLMLLLIAAIVLAQLLYIVIGAVAGYTLPEKSEKVAALSFMWGVQQAVQHPILRAIPTAFGYIYAIVTVAGSLLTYWYFPIGDREALVRIAVFVFTVRQITGILISLIEIWPVVISPYLDDDLRNSYLGGSFSNIVSSTIILLFPVWLLDQQGNTLLGQLPPFWLLLSVPILVFFIGTVIPFLVGVNSYRTQANLLLNWRRQWVNDVLAIVKLPLGDRRSMNIEMYLQNLEAELKERRSNNTLDTFYRTLINEEIEEIEQPDGTQSIQADSTASTEALATSQQNPADSGAPTMASQPAATVSTASQATPPKPVAQRQPDNASQKQLINIINRNMGKLTQWDIQIGHISRLNELMLIVPDGKSQDISGYLERRLATMDAEAKSFSSTKNVLAGTSLTLISGVMVFLFQTYQKQIVSLVGNLVGMNLQP